jgi:hypothetical protein
MLLLRQKARPDPFYASFYASVVLLRQKARPDPFYASVVLLRQKARPDPFYVTPSMDQKQDLTPSM